MLTLLDLSLICKTTLPEGSSEGSEADSLGGGEDVSKKYIENFGSVLVTSKTWYPVALVAWFENLTKNIHEFFFTSSIISNCSINKI